jgi:hypothetical protein
MAKHELVEMRLDALPIPEGEDAPTEIRLFAIGETKTRKGPVRFDGECSRLVMAEYDAGRDPSNDRALMFDFEHKSLDPQAPAGAGKASGWGRLEARDDGLYAADIAWTEEALRGLSARPPEWKHFSPAVVLDTKTRRVTRVINCALTNLPATLGQRPLALAEDSMLTGGLAEVARKLGLDAEMATETDVSTALDVLMKEHLEIKAKAAGAISSEAYSELLTLTGKSAPIEAFSAAADGLKELASLKAETVKAEAKGIVDTLLSSGAADPWQKDFLLRLGGEDIAWLRDYADKARAKVQEPAIRPDTSAKNMLSDDDKATMVALGMDPANHDDAQSYMKQLAVSKAQLGLHH